ncbi:DUF4390 domain-containing protein [Roseateles sp. BYS180W]|uniref:DUF4390 domain-containing protein n=1 Tax=Roseateles rivi TaxID=3299028 RepID=A0ABW7FTA0_9BURK
MQQTPTAHARSVFGSAARRLLGMVRGCWLALVLLLVVPGGVWAQAPSIQLQHLSTERSEDGLRLSFSTRFELSKPVEDALHKGVPVYFSAEARLRKSRWYWRDARITESSRSWRLSWQPLTRQYRVSTGGLHQSYESLPEALASLRGASGWRIAEAKDLDDASGYYLEFSYRLDTSQLPKPLQIGLVQGWDLALEHKQPVNVDSPARTSP